MIVELMDCLEDMTEEAQSFIKTLYHHVDPYEPLPDQLEGNPEKQIKWLHSLYERHINEDEEAVNDIWDN